MLLLNHIQPRKTRPTTDKKHVQRATLRTSFRIFFKDHLPMAKEQKRWPQAVTRHSSVSMSLSFGSGWVISPTETEGSCDRKKHVMRPVIEAAKRWINWIIEKEGMMQIRMQHDIQASQQPSILGDIVKIHRYV